MVRKVFQMIFRKCYTTIFQKDFSTLSSRDFHIQTDNTGNSDICKYTHPSPLSSNLTLSAPGRPTINSPEKFQNHLKDVCLLQSYHYNITAINDVVCYCIVSAIFCVKHEKRLEVFWGTYMYIHGVIDL